MNKPKIIRTSTVSTSLNTFCKGFLRELSAEYDVIALSSPDKDLKEIEEREGVRCIGVAMERHISPLKDFVSLVRLIRIFRRERPAMVHSITPKAGLLSMIAAWVARVPVRIHTFTGLVFPTSTGVKRGILMLTDSITCACATHIIPEGEGVKNDLLFNGITKKNLKVLGYGNVRGVDMQYYSRSGAVMDEARGIRGALGIEEGVTTFLFVGRLVGDKGMKELVEAFTRLHSERGDVRLILVGREEPQLDPLDEETKTRIAANGAITAVGEKSDVRPWYAAADALVFPSYREGFPNVVLEAGALDLPSIVTDINGSREIIIEGKNGTIVQPRSTEQLYRAMRLFAEHPHTMRQMAQNARAMVAERFEQGFVRQCLKDYYKEIL